MLRNSQRTRPRAAVSTSVVLLLGALALPSAVAAQEKYRILVTNDDGIDSSALEALVVELSEIAEVVVAAPAEDHSYAGLGKTIPSGMLRIQPVEMKGAAEAYAVEGTPVDAVTWALLAHGQAFPFDAVVAGINRGTTLGDDALSTGVVGAVLTAARYGLPEIAVAQDRGAHIYDVAAGLTKLLLEKWIESGLGAAGDGAAGDGEGTEGGGGIALSVNIPAAATTRPRGVVISPLGLPEYNTTGFKKVERDSPDELWLVQYKKNRRPERGTDLDWYQRGEITITPIGMGITATDLVETLEGWELVAERAL